MHVLFVCTGNTCRSPMAAAYVKAVLCRAGFSNCEISSAGLAAWANSPASDGAAAVMQEQGIDLSGFRSTRVSVPLLESADMICTMSQSHLEAINSACPEMSGKCCTLLDDNDVPDPYGGSVDRYREVFEVMRPALDRITERIMSINI